MKLRLLYFAVLRDITGKAEDEVEVAGDTTPASLWETLRGRHTRLAGYVQPPMVAVNETWSSPDATLRDGDVVAFIPPVSGG